PLPWPPPGPQARRSTRRTRRRARRTASAASSRPGARRGASPRWYPCERPALAVEDHRQVPAREVRPPGAQVRPEPEGQAGPVPVPDLRAATPAGYPTGPTPVRDGVGTYE